MTMGGGQNDARYRIGPLTTYVDPGELEAWHRGAEAGDEMVYAIGPALGAEAATAKCARRLQEAGLAMLFLRREAGGIHYVIRKREPRPGAGAAAIDPRAPAGPERGLYEVLVQLADEGLTLPSLELLAERAGLQDRQAAHYRMTILINGGHIRLHEAGGRRVVEIAATGQRTAETGRRA